MDSIRVEFYGGHRDGQIIAMPVPLPLVFREHVLDHTLLAEIDDPTAVVPTRIREYHLNRRYDGRYVYVAPREDNP